MKWPVSRARFDALAESARRASAAVIDWQREAQAARAAQASADGRFNDLLAKYDHLVAEIMTMRRDGFTVAPKDAEPYTDPLPADLAALIDLKFPRRGNDWKQQRREALKLINNGTSEADAIALIARGSEMEF